MLLSEDLFRSCLIIRQSTLSVTMLGRVTYMLSTKMLSMFVKWGSIDDSLVSLVKPIRFFGGN